MYTVSIRILDTIDLITFRLEYVHCKGVVRRRVLCTRVFLSVVSLSLSRTFVLLSF